MLCIENNILPGWPQIQTWDFLFLLFLVRTSFLQWSSSWYSPVSWRGRLISAELPLSSFDFSQRSVLNVKKWICTCFTPAPFFWAAQGQYVISFIFLGVYYFSLGLQELLLNLTHAHTTPLSCSKNCFSTGFQCLSLTAGVPCLPEIQPNPRVCKQARAKQAQDFGRDGMWSLSWYVESYCAAHAQL